MRVLIVCSGNVPNFIFKIQQSFIYEQIETVKKNFGINYDTYFIKGKGILGYLKNLPDIKKKIKDFSPDIIHAHFGLSGLICCIQRSVPVVITFHGSDINNIVPFLFSKIAILLSYNNIFVSTKLAKKAKSKSNFTILSCGVDLNIFKEVGKDDAKQAMQISPAKKNILFSSSFCYRNKNYELAKSAINILSSESMDVNLIELKGYNRQEVNVLMNAVDCLLVTSFKESGPLVVKEAMACGCPVVSVDVGDVFEIIGNTEGCFITSYDAKDVADKIKKAIHFGKRTNGRQKILHLDNNIISEKLYNIYMKVFNDTL